MFYWVVIDFSNLLLSVIIYLLMKVKYTILEKFLAHYDAKLKNKKGQSLKSPLMLRKEALKQRTLEGIERASL